MKKSLLLVLFIVFSLVSYAQNFKNDGKPYSYFCEIYRYGTTNIEIKWPENKKDTHLSDENGKLLEFNNVFEALNYMSKRGWELVSVTYVNERTGEKAYILKKMVSNDKEAKEGLYFDKDFK